METTEKIVESYVRFVKGWATIPNIRCKGQNEIDLFAIDPNSNEKYHIEVSVSGSAGFSKLTDKPFDPDQYKDRVQKAKQRRTVGFFVDRKFCPETVKSKLAEYGCPDGDARKVIVTWDWTPESKIAADAANIELWSFQDIMHEIADEIRHQRSYFSDDTLRTINLFVRALKARDNKVEPIKTVRKKPSQKKAATAPYWVYRNWIHNRARLHRSECSYCNNGRGTQNVTNSSTGEWRSFKVEKDANAFLNSFNYKDAARCGVCQ